MMHAIGVSLLVAAAPAVALDQVAFRIQGATEALDDALRGASLTDAARRDGRLDPQEVFAAARADYGRLIGVLYAAGHYSGTISILVDGREAAGIAPLDAPRSIRRVEIDVRPGPQFRFGTAEVAPMAGGTVLPAGFAPGAVAESGVIRDAAEAAVTGWRAVGHAKAAIGSQDIVAQHPQARLDARLTVTPGPRLRFGPMRFTGQERMRLARLEKIAGLPVGSVFSPEDLRKAAERLRRTGVFRSVALAEDETPGADGTLGITAAVSEMPLRRLGFAAEITNTDGAALSAFWMHRNLFGGAERFRVEAEIGRIGAAGGGPDWALRAEIERPASFTPDTSARFQVEIGQERRTDYRIDGLSVEFGLAHIFSDRLTARADIRFGQSRVRDSFGSTTYRHVALPLGLTWDRRDDRFDPGAGTWLDAEIMPFKGFGTTGTGVRAVFDARIYQRLGARAVVAARLQGGAIWGSTLGETPRDYLFYSGGGGTVRGHPYQSLGVIFGRMKAGGTRFLAGSVELRGRITDNIGIVGFVDYGRVSDSRWPAPAPGWHAGAGLGLRYATPVGPLRLDIAAPVGGVKGRGAQFYLGIGQAF